MGSKRKAWESLLEIQAPEGTSYEPRVYPGKITVFSPSEQLALYHYEPDMGWGKLAGGGVEVMSSRAVLLSSLKNSGSRTVVGLPLVSIVFKVNQGFSNFRMGDLETEVETPARGFVAFDIEVFRAVLWGTGCVRNSPATQKSR